MSQVRQVEASPADRARGIVFKGSGFYQTDYRSESYKKGAAAEKIASTPKSETKEKKSG